MITIVSPMDEARLLHPTAGSGYFALLTERSAEFPDHPFPFQQRSYRVTDHEEVLNGLLLDQSVFLSQNLFYRGCRRSAFLQHLCLCWQDLDVYKCGYHSDDLDRVAMAVRLFCDDQGIPLPSLIVSSGRGLYLKWLLISPIPRHALIRWRMVQQHLCGKLTEFGADRQALDASRVLRVVGSLNRKAGQDARVRVLWQNQVDGQIVRYSFETLADEVLPLTRKQLRALQAARADQTERTKTSRHTAAEAPGTLRPFDEAQLWWLRIEDIRMLAHLRHPSGVPMGHRDLYLFPIACGYAWCRPVDRLMSELTAVASELCPSLSSVELRSLASDVLHRAQRAGQGERLTYDGKFVDPRYCFRNATLLERLKITPDEQCQMITLIDQSEKQERHRRRNRKACDRTTYVQQAQKRREEARALRAEGRSCREIAAILGTTTIAVYGLLQNR